MSNESINPSQSAAEQIFRQIEQALEAGEVRDLWLNLRSELADGGIEGVRTYLESEYERRRAIVQNAMEDLTNQLEEIT